MRGITPSVKFLLILNIAVFLFDVVFNQIFGIRLLANLFALPSAWWPLSAGQLFTYMFVHGSLSHLLMNMLGLFFIGPVVERTLGSFRFFILYYLSGILGGLGWSLLAGPHDACVGASGALMGVLGAFGALYPKAELRLIFFPFFPIKAWIFVLILAFIELYQTVGHPIIGGVANSAHLMGGIAGFCYAATLKHPHLFRNLLGKIPGMPASKHAPSRPGPKPQTLSKEDIDHILDKIGKQGMGALTNHEREMLKRATR